MATSFENKVKLILWYT